MLVMSGPLYAAAAELVIVRLSVPAPPSSASNADRVSVAPPFACRPTNVSLLAVPVKESNAVVNVNVCPGLASTVSVIPDPVRLSACPNEI